MLISYIFILLPNLSFYPTLLLVIDCSTMGLDCVLI